MSFGLTGMLKEENERAICVHEPSWNRDFWIPVGKIETLERNLGTDWVTVYIDAQYAARHLDLEDYMHGGKP